MSTSSQPELSHISDGNKEVGGSAEDQSRITSVSGGLSAQSDLPLSDSTSPSQSASSMPGGSMNMPVTSAETTELPLSLKETGFSKTLLQSRAGL